ncbi:MAG: hypothetical protein PHC69_07615 [Ruminiclostridium sp.]|nr:hypothetical protein [Ruminiclostridium sp.]
MINKQKSFNENSKNEQLEIFRSKDNEDKVLTTNQGLKLSEDSQRLSVPELSTLRFKIIFPKYLNSCTGDK